MDIPQIYIDKIQGRPKLRYLLGLAVRVPLFIKNELSRMIAKQRGAQIGEASHISLRLALRANSNLIVGKDCCIDAQYLDLRGKIVIGNHVIINSGVEIIRDSHYVDERCDFATRSYGILKIEDYSWLATSAKVLPQVTLIDKGTICGAYSVLSKNTSENSVFVGNPAFMVRQHTSVHSDILVCSLSGRDLRYYLKARFI